MYVEETERHESTMNDYAGVRRCGMVGSTIHFNIACKGSIRNDGSRSRTIASGEPKAPVFLQIIFFRLYAYVSKYDNNGWLLAEYDLSNQVRYISGYVVVVPVESTTIHLITLVNCWAVCLCSTIAPPP